METYLYISVLFILFMIFFDYIKKNRNKKEKYILNYTFPNNVKNTLKKTYPHLNEDEINLVLKGLKEYFNLYTLASRRIIAMPSRVLDIAWHGFILSTHEYQEFCKNAFGVFLHHVPVESIKNKNDVQNSIKISWKLSCQRYEINPLNPNKLPLIFSLDTLLKIPDGYEYSIDCFENDSAFYVKDIGCIGIIYLP